MNIDEKDILKTNVLETWVDGKKVHQENERKRFGLVEIIDDTKK